MGRFCQVLPHSADLKIRLRASSWPDLVKKAALCFSSLVLDSDDFSRRKESKNIEIVLQGETKEERLVNFFNDLIFILETQSLLLKAGKLRDNKFFGFFFEVKEEEIKERIKSATFHGLKIKRNKDGLRVEVVFDV